MTSPQCFDSKDRKTHPEFYTASRIRYDAAITITPKHLNSLFARPGEAMDTERKRLIHWFLEKARRYLHPKFGNYHWTCFCTFENAALASDGLAHAHILVSFTPTRKKGKFGLIPLNPRHEFDRAADLLRSKFDVQVKSLASKEESNNWVSYLCKLEDGQRTYKPFIWHGVPITDGLAESETAALIL